MPFLINPVNGVYDISELQSLRAYCFLHADRAAKGEAVVNDLIKSGLADSTYQDWSCIKITEALEAEAEAADAQSGKELAIAIDCMYGNLAPSQYQECSRAGHTMYDSELCNFDASMDVLTPEERLECENAGHKLIQEEEDKDEDEDTKE
jgi:hypothetical protein